MSLSKTIVINCAGTGSRLGFGHTKALLKIGKKPLIIRHLELLNEFDDIRIVVGFDAKNLIDTVLSYRKNVVFVLNHQYLTTNTLSSLYLGSKYGRNYIVSLDGDLLVKPEYLNKFLKTEDEVVGYTKSYSENAVYVDIEKKPNEERVLGFGRKKKDFEWTGLLQIKKERINYGTGHIYPIIKPLPIKGMYIDCREIDTPKDYDMALIWAKKNL